MPALILVLSLFLPGTSAGRPAAPRPAGVAEAEVLRVYDVSRLTGQLALDEHVRALSGGFVQGPGREAFEELDRWLSRTRSTVEGLLQSIRENVQPPLRGEQRLEHLGGSRLSLFATEPQQAWLETFLSEAVGLPGFVDIQVVMYMVPEAAAARYAGRHGEVLLAPELQRVSTHLDSDGVDKLTAPRVLVFPFSKASLAAGEELAYVKDYEFKVLADRSGEVADPVIDTIQDGLKLEVRPIPLAGGKLRIHVDLTYQRLERPIPSLETTLNRLASPVVVQLPEWAVVHAAGHFALSPGECVLLTSDSLLRGKRAVVLLKAATVPEVVEAGDRER